ncbi:hypothetical protein [Bacillus sp. 37MA]|uniref:hypothetical protein n=1 Tax=Bacillus sp. 37MA TaxID=1132442 RepID=UPI000686B916|nr:hypothetical protein [Bacillus sp. 37MA]
MVNIPKDIIFTINSIRNELKDNGIQISDRRFMKALPLIRANAALNGRFEVMPADLSILRNGLWETPDQRETCATVIDAYSVDKVQSEIERIQKVVLETMSAVQSDPSSEIGMEATKKMKFCIEDLATLNQQYPNRSAEIIAMRTKVDEANQRIANVMIGV